MMIDNQPIISDNQLLGESFLPGTHPQWMESTI